MPLTEHRLGGSRGAALLVAIAAITMACGRLNEPPTRGATPTRTADPSETAGSPAAASDGRTKPQAADSGPAVADEAAAGCDASPGACDASGSIVYSKYPGYERVTRERALEWWSHRPVLVPTTLPQAGSEELIFATSPAGGTSGRADSGAASLVILNVYPPQDASSSLQQVIDGGGVKFEAKYLPANVPYSPLKVPTKPIRVRGESAQLIEFYAELADDEQRPWRYQNHDGRNARLVRWFKTLPDGATLVWTLTTNSRSTTEAQTLRIIEDAASP